MNKESKQSAKVRWREFFLLEQRLADARREAFRPLDAGWAEFVLGRAALEDADQLAHASDSAGSALLLYRAAVELLASAHRARPAEHVATPEGTESPLRLPPEQASVAELPNDQRTIVQEALEAGSSEVHLAKISDAQRRLALQGMQRVARALAAPLEIQANGVQGLSRQRWLRVGLSSALTLVLVLWVVAKIFEPTNLALNKSVTVSSNFEGGEYPPAKVVDGDRSNIGFHTDCSERQWVNIDLGRVETIHTVDVFNRTDCCQQRTRPLLLEASPDGEQFALLDRRTAEFDEWSVELTPTQARFIRLTNESANCFHLAEIEVY